MIQEEVGVDSGYYLRTIANGSLTDGYIYLEVGLELRISEEDADRVALREGRHQGCDALLGSGPVGVVIRELRGQAAGDQVASSVHPPGTGQRARQILKNNDCIKEI